MKSQCILVFGLNACMTCFNKVLKSAPDNYRTYPLFFVLKEYVYRKPQKNKGIKSLIKTKQGNISIPHGMNLSYPLKEYIY